jgi:hypothetical protein
VPRWAVTFFDDSIEEARKVMHPNGSCTCAGEGVCGWCATAAAAQGQDLEAFSMRPEHKTWFDDVFRFFVGAHGSDAVPDKPTFDAEAVKLYWRLVGEELKEMQEGFEARDPVEYADGIADTIWVLMGLAIASGIDLSPVWAEVSRSNLEKLGGTKRADGKLMKPPGWRPPDIAAALKRRRVR